MKIHSQSSLIKTQEGLSASASAHCTGNVHAAPWHHDTVPVQNQLPVSLHPFYTQKIGFMAMPDAGYPSLGMQATFLCSLSGWRRQHIYGSKGCLRKCQSTRVQSDLCKSCMLGQYPPLCSILGRLPLWCRCQLERRHTICGAQEVWGLLMHFLIQNARRCWWVHIVTR